jgi:hypothetical protein
LSQHQKELDRHFAWFEKKLPPRPAKFVSWVRKPSSIYARIPLAILLVAGGFLSFLPVLGLWMLPLGLLLFAQDVPPLQKPMAQGLGWIERKWLERQRAKLERERAMSRSGTLQGIQPIRFSVVTVITRVTQKPALLAITWLHRGIP